MKRANDWPTELANFLLTTRKTPFKWGENDCCLFAANAILAMGGDDVAKDVRGHYTTAIGARRIMKNLGAASVVELLTQRLGEPIRQLRRVGHLRRWHAHRLDRLAPHAPRGVRHVATGR